MATMAQPVVEEGKLLSEALNTVKIQVQQMKRHLVRIGLVHLLRPINAPHRNWISSWML